MELTNEGNIVSQDLTLELSNSGDGLLVGKDGPINNSVEVNRLVLNAASTAIASKGIMADYNLDGHVFLSGKNGVGKTTTMYNLLYMTSDFEKIAGYSTLNDVEKFLFMNAPLKSSQINHRKTVANANAWIAIQFKRFIDGKVKLQTLLAFKTPSDINKELMITQTNKNNSMATFIFIDKGIDESLLAPFQGDSISEISKKTPLELIDAIKNENIRTSSFHTSSSKTGVLFNWSAKDVYIKSAVSEKKYAEDKNTFSVFTITKELKQKIDKTTYDQARNESELAKKKANNGHVKQSEYFNKNLASLLKNEQGNAEHADFEGSKKAFEKFVRGLKTRATNFLVANALLAEKECNDFQNLKGDGFSLYASLKNLGFLCNHLGDMQSCFANGSKILIDNINKYSEVLNKEQEDLQKEINEQIAAKDKEQKFIDEANGALRTANQSYRSALEDLERMVPNKEKWSLLEDAEVKIDLFKKKIEALESRKNSLLSNKKDQEIQTQIENLNGDIRKLQEKIGKLGTDEGIAKSNMDSAETTLKAVRQSVSLNLNNEFNQSVHGLNDSLKDLNGIKCEEIKDNKLYIIKSDESEIDMHIDLPKIEKCSIDKNQTNLLSQKLDNLKQQRAILMDNLEKHSSKEDELKEFEEKVSRKKDEIQQEEKNANASNTHLEALNKEIEDIKNNIKDLENRIATNKALKDKETLLKVAYNGDGDVQDTIVMLDNVLTSLDVVSNQEDDAQGISLEDVAEKPSISGVFVNGKKVVITDNNIASSLRDKLVDLSTIDEEIEKDETLLGQKRSLLQEKELMQTQLNDKVNESMAILEDLKVELSELQDNVTSLSQECNDCWGASLTSLRGVNDCIKSIKNIIDNAKRELSAEINKVKDEFEKSLETKVASSPEVIEATSKLNVAKEKHKEAQHKSKIKREIKENEIEVKRGAIKKLEGVMSKNDISREIDEIDNDIELLQKDISFINSNKHRYQTYKNFEEEVAAKESKLQEERKVHGPNVKSISETIKTLEKEHSIVVQYKKALDEIKLEEESEQNNGNEALMEFIAKFQNKVSEYDYVFKNNTFASSVADVDYTQESKERMLVSSSEDFKKLLSLYKNIEDEFDFKEPKNQNELKENALKMMLNKQSLVLSENDREAIVYTKLLRKNGSKQREYLENKISDIQSLERKAPDLISKTARHLEKIINEASLGKRDELNDIFKEFKSKAENDYLTYDDLNESASSKMVSDGNRLLAWYAFLNDVYLNSQNAQHGGVNTNNEGIIIKSAAADYKNIKTDFHEFLSNVEELKKYVKNINRVAGKISFILNNSALSIQRKAYSNLKIKVIDKVNQENSPLLTKACDVAGFINQTCTNTEYVYEECKNLVKVLQDLKSSILEGEKMGSACADLILKSNINGEDLFDTDITVDLDKGNMVKENISIFDVSNKASTGNLLTVKMCFAIATIAYATNNKKFKDKNLSFNSKVFIDECSAVDSDNLSHILELAKQNNISLLLATPNMPDGAVANQISTINCLHQAGQNMPTTVQKATRIDIPREMSLSQEEIQGVF